MIIVIAIARSEKPKKELKKKKRKKRGSFLNMFFLEKNPFMKDSAMMVVNFMSNLKIIVFWIQYCVSIELFTHESQVCTSC